jgi:multiple sugar transport system permease protein
MKQAFIHPNFARPLALGVVLAILIFFALFPLVWIALTSLKPNAAILSKDPIFLFEPTLEHWRKVLFEGDFLRYYANSLITAITTVIVVMSAATLAAFGLARFNMDGKEDVAFFILSQRMMPPVAVVLPYFLLASSAGALDTYWVLIAVNVGFNLPLSVWMIRGFVEGTSREIEEAAIMDGASPLGAFFRVTVPQIWPGLLSTALFVYIYTVNEFLFASILSGTNVRPVSVAVQLFLPTGVRGTLFGEAAVASILIILPGLVFASIMQRYLVSGVSMGAVKG